MFDGFEVAMTILDAWFSLCFREKKKDTAFRCSLTADKLKLVLFVVGVSSTWQVSGHPTPSPPGLRIMSYTTWVPIRPLDRQSLFKLHQTPWPWEESGTPVISSPPKSHWDSFWKGEEILAHPYLSYRRTGLWGNRSSWNVANPRWRW